MSLRKEPLWITVESALYKTVVHAIATKQFFLLAGLSYSQVEVNRILQMLMEVY